MVEFSPNINRVMTSRSRPRGNMKDEERDMWSQLLVDIKRAKAINTLCAEKSNHIATKETEMSKGRFSNSVCFPSLLFQCVHFPEKASVYCVPRP